MSEDEKTGETPKLPAVGEAPELKVIEFPKKKEVPVAKNAVTALREAADQFEKEFTQEECDSLVYGVIILGGPTDWTVRYIGALPPTMYGGLLSSALVKHTLDTSLE